ncbi:MAG: Gldg family protein [Thermodesulfobacteriota bacterium]
MKLAASLSSRSGMYSKFFIYVVAIVLINAAGLTMFFRADLTGEGIYSISEASKRMVSTLSEPLTINVFFTRNLPAPHNNTERYLRDLLEEYSVYANQYFNYRFYDVSPEEGISQQAEKNQELARSYGIYPVQIRAIQEDEVTFQKAYMGLVMIHGDLIERIPTITNTDGLEYRLTTAIQKLHSKISALLRLPEKIRLKLFLSSSLEAVAPYMQLGDLSKLPEKLREVAEKVSGKNYGKLEFEYIDPSADEDLNEIAKYNLMSIKWPELSGGKVPAGRGVVGLVTEYEGKVREVPLIRVVRLPLIGKRYELVNVREIEETVNENIESLIEINEDIGYLADHGTHTLSAGVSRDPRKKGDALSRFRNLVSQSYTIKHVSLKDGLIPKSINCLIIARPTESFSDYDLFQIDQFLMQGNNVALFLDRFEEVIPSKDPQTLSGRVHYVPIKTGLKKLLEHYGIEVGTSYVLDEHCYKQSLSARYGGGEQAVYFVPVIKNELINRDVAFMKNINGLITMKISPLRLYPERIKENDLQAYRLFSSSERSWQTGKHINPTALFRPPPNKEEEMKSYPLAYIIEGEFPSYFAGKPVPEKTSAEEQANKPEEKQSGEKSVDLSKIETAGKRTTKGKPGKIFVIATSEMLRDNMLDMEGKSPNAIFILNVLDYLNNREGIAELRSKEQRFNPLIEVGGGTTAFVKMFNIAGLPIFVILFGLAVWFFRHSRKKRIRMMFQK